jgi:hypothetical protein
MKYYVHYPHEVIERELAINGLTAGEVQTLIDTWNKECIEDGYVFRYSLKKEEL